MFVTPAYSDQLKSEIGPLEHISEPTKPVQSQKGDSFGESTLFVIAASNASSDESSEDELRDLEDRLKDARELNAEIRLLEQQKRTPESNQKLQDLLERVTDLLLEVIDNEIDDEIFALLNIEFAYAKFVQKKYDQVIDAFDNAAEVINLSPENLIMFERANALTGGFEESLAAFAFKQLKEFRGR